jgi:hypothetical protein
MADDDDAAELAAWLGENGYTTATTAVDVGAPGNRVVRMQHGGCQVTITRDRGQWYVEAGPPDRDGFDMNLWESYLRLREPDMEAATFAEDVRLLHNLLHEIESSLLLDARAVEHLDDLQAWLLETRWSTPV